MCRFLTCFILLCGLLAPVCAQQFYVIPVFPSTPVQSMQVWGGGLVVGQDSLSSVRLSRTDSFGGYLYGNDTKWHQLITSISMAPAACEVTYSIPNSCFGVYPTTGTSQTYQGFGGGVVEACASPASPSTAFMFYNGFVFKSTNINPASPDSFTFINTKQLPGGGFGPFTNSSNLTSRENGRMMACDPNNANHVLVGTVGNGLLETLDGGSTFNRLAASDIPNSPVGASLNYEIAFDPASGTSIVTCSTCIGGTATVTSTVYVFTPGTVAVSAATTAAADTSGLAYVNGTAGVGATLTGTVNTAITIDGFTFTATGQRLLVKNDTQSPSGAFNGIYSLTQLQTASLAPILTRTTDNDSAAEMNATGAIPVLNGTVNATTSWLPTSTVVTVGTSPLTYTQRANGGVAGIYASTTGGAVGTWSQISGLVAATFIGTGSGTTLTVSAVTGAINLTNNVISGTGVPNGTSIISGGPTTYTTSGTTTSSGAALTAFTGPITTQHMIVAAGNLWVTSTAGALTEGTSGSLWRYSSGTWIRILTNCCEAIAVNPLNTNQVAAMLATGQLFTATDGGVSGASFSAELLFTIAPGDTAWLGGTVALTANDISFDANVNGKLWCNCGQGVWTTTFPTTSPFVWTANVAGIMQPIGQQIVSPKAGVAVAGFQDVGLCVLSFASNVPPSNCFAQLTASRSLEFASGIDYSKTDANFMVAKISPNLNGGSDYSGYSTDDFATTYWPFNSWNATVTAASLTNNGSNLVRVTIPDTSGLTTYNAGAGSIVCSISSVNAVGTSNPLSVGPNQTGCFPVTKVSTTQFDITAAWGTGALANTGGNYLFYVPTPPASYWGGALNVTGAVNDGTGKIKINYMFPVSSALASSGWACINGVLGTTEANGCWIISGLVTTVGSASFVLNGSTFANAYTGGGVITTWSDPGGSAAAASDINFVTIASNSSTAPKCTLDGGKTWTDVTNAAIPTIDVNGNTHVTGGPYAAGTTNITVADTTQIKVNTVVWIPMDDGRYFYSPIAAVSPASGPGTITFRTNQVIPTGRSIATGAGVFIRSGWGDSASTSNTVVAADYLQPNTFFAVNYNVGLVKWTSCNPATVVASTSYTGGNWLQSGNGASILKTVPGQSGHMLFTAGNQAAPFALTGLGLWQVCNGDNNVAGATLFYRLPGVFTPNRIGLGPPKPGSSGYASILEIGWYDPTGSNTQANSIFGTWESTDNPNNGNSGAGAVCKLTSAQFTGIISGNQLVATSVTGTIHAGDGILMDPTNGAINPTATNTQIVSGPAGGGAGTYTLNNSQNVSSEAMTAGGTFHQIGTWPAAFPNGPSWQTVARDITGDRTVYGPIYMNTAAGPFKQTVNFLLKRDIDPTANDNNPVGLGMFG